MIELRTTLELETVFVEDFNELCILNFLNCITDTAEVIQTSIRP